MTATARLVVLCACLSSCFPGISRLPPVIVLKDPPTISGATDVGFAAGILAEHGYFIEFASREAGVVNTSWLGFTITLPDTTISARDRIQVSASGAGVTVIYDYACDYPYPAAMGNGCRETIRSRGAVTEVLKSRFKRIWTAVRDATKAPKGLPAER